MTNRNWKKLFEVINSCDLDAILAVEPNQWWQQRLDEHLDELYPYSLKRPPDNLYGMLLYSRLLLQDARFQYLVEPDIPSLHGELILRSGREIKLHCLPGQAVILPALYFHLQLEPMPCGT